MLNHKFSDLEGSWNENLNLLFRFTKTKNFCSTSNCFICGLQNKILRRIIHHPLFSLRNNTYSQTVNFCHRLSRSSSSCGFLQLLNQLFLVDDFATILFSLRQLKYKVLTKATFLIVITIISPKLTLF